MITTIAEIGINHNGDIMKAFKLLRLAKATEFTCAKFQKRNPDRYPERPYNSPVFGQTTYREHKRGLEFNMEQYVAIDSLAKDLDIEWTASPFDFESVDFLLYFDVPFIKIASPVTLNLPLVEYIASQGKPVVMSTGMCTLEDVDGALRRLTRYLEPSQITLLHCNSEYPTPIENANLSMIPRLAELYKPYFVENVGYSSHDGGVVVPVQSVSYGATVIEAHITENRMQPGSDHKVSLEETGMRTLNRHARAAEIAIGKPEKIVTPGEQKIREKVAQQGADRQLAHEAIMTYLEQDA